MWQASEQISIDAPPERVWDVVADLSNHVALAGSGEVRTITDISGPLAVGTTFRSVNVIPKAGELTALEEIVECEPGRALGWRSIPPPLRRSKPDSVPDIRWRYLLEPDGTGTRVTHSFRAVPPKPGGLVMRLFYLVARRRNVIVRGMRRTLANLKAMVETGHAQER